MKPYALIVIVIILLITACEKKSNTVISNDIFLKETNDPKKTTKQILDHFLESVSELAQTDTSVYYYGNAIIEEDSTFRQLFVGKFIDQKAIIATEINVRDSVINFYHLDNRNWKLIGSAKTNIPVYKTDFEDLDGDNRNEIITSTSRNMNGNTWQEVYYYSNSTNTIHYAGSYSTDYIVKKDKKQIEETYEGSSYMDHSKTLYEWREEKLVPIRQIILRQNQPDTENQTSTFEYYENSTNKAHGLKLKFKEPFDNDNKKQQELWDTFFDAK